MKKFFEEPSIECLVLRTENITDVVEGSTDTVTNPDGWQ